MCYIKSRTLFYPKKYSEHGGFDIVGIKNQFEDRDRKKKRHLKILVGLER